MLHAHIMIVNQEGNILESALPFSLNEEDKSFQFSKQVLREFHQVEEHTEEMTLTVQTEDVPDMLRLLFEQGKTYVVPVIGGGTRLATLLFVRHQTNTQDDLILSEYCSTLIGSEILRKQHKEYERVARKRAVVSLAMSSLSYSEIEAIKGIFEQLEGKEGIVIASNVADKAGITRSVIVNALRKLESAGVIESRSLGMKGTYIKVLNDNIMDEIQKMNSAAIV